LIACHRTKMAVERCRFESLQFVLDESGGHLV
jgi:hypothetical protein